MEFFKKICSVFGHITTYKHRHRQLKILPYNTVRKPNINKSKSASWRDHLPLVKLLRSTNKYFHNQTMQKINILFYKAHEQYLISKWIKPYDIVLEFSDNYGITSCAIQLMLDVKIRKYHVLVEPDIGTHTTIETNREMISNCTFEICEHMINDNEYCFASFDFDLDTEGCPDPEPSLNEIRVIKTISNETFFTKYPQKFNVIIALSDYVACLYNMMIQNESILYQIEVVLFETGPVYTQTQYCDFICELLKKYDFSMCDCAELSKIEGEIWIKYPYLQVWKKNS